MGHQKMTASMRWTVPQVKMKAANSQKIRGKGRSRLRKTRNASTNGIAV
jgi:hypothetical protein